MDWNRHRKLSSKWRKKSEAYVAAVNRFVANGLAKGWEKAGKPPKDNRGDLADSVLAVVKEANRAGEWRGLREHFPPAHEPFVDKLEKLAIGIEDVLWIDDEHVVARVGPPWAFEAVVEFGIDGSYTATDALAVGRSPDRRWYAIARERQIEVRDGYRGAARAKLRLPKFDAPLIAVQPFPNGNEVLVTRDDGVFVLSNKGLRGFPLRDDDAEGDDDETPSFAMIHSAMSPDGKLVAVGHQDSPHLVFTRGGRRIARFGPIHSSYPHHAAFSPDGAYAIFNSCHFYNGATVIVSVPALAGLDVEPYEEDRSLRMLEDSSRVYASSFIGGAFVLGDAYGYLRACSPKGKPKWQLFCGSSIGGIDVSPDGRKLAVATAAGYLQLYDLDVKDPDRFQIGTGRHRERLRFVRWRGHPMLRW